MGSDGKEGCREMNIVKNVGSGVQVVSELYETALAIGQKIWIVVI